MAAALQSTSVTDAPAPEDQAPPTRRWLRPGLLLAGLALLGLVVLRGFLIQTYIVPSGSMEPAIEPGDRIVVLRALDDDALKRGDIVVFDGTRGFASPERSPHQSEALMARFLAGAASVAGVSTGERYFVKRIVGLPGDRVTCCDPQGRVTVNGVGLDEEYLFAGDHPSRMTFDVVVPPESIWVMGDHRSSSGDSRSHLGSTSGGMVFVDNIVGKAAATYWPLSRTGLFETPQSISSVPRVDAGR